MLSFRKRLGITKHIHALVFEQADSAMRVINFYNQVKRVIIRSGNDERKINLKVFIDLIHELRIKFDIAKIGLAAEKTMRVIDFGLKTDGAGDDTLSDRC